jgi:hypothetical protein
MPAYFRTSPGTTAVNSTAIFFLTSLGSPAPAAAPDLRGHGSQASAKEANRLELVMATAKP